MSNDVIDRTLQRGLIVHLIGGTDADAEAIVEAAVADRELDRVTIPCSDDTTAEAIPSARVPDGTLVYYGDFGDLPSEVQVTAAQCIKGHFEFGIPVIVRSSVADRGDLTLRNGDLHGRVRAIELDDTNQDGQGETDETGDSKTETD